jgi:hypothetical protein
MDGLEIKNQGITMEWCCERMEKVISLGTDITLCNFNRKTALWMVVGKRGMPGMEPIIYCPFCGIKVAIIDDPHDEVLYKGIPTKKPKEWKEWDL